MNREFLSEETNGKSRCRVSIKSTEDVGKRLDSPVQRRVLKIDKNGEVERVHNQQGIVRRRIARQNNDAGILFLISLDDGANFSRRMTRAFLPSFIEFGTLSSRGISHPIFPSHEQHAVW